MAKRVLIANRGEIACRIARSCRDLGVVPVGICSLADMNARHVRHMDQAVEVGPGPARDSYLRIDRILAAAKTMQADAVHPGYGFLAENAQFAQAVEDAGLIWIGPTPATISAMGNKRYARSIAAKNGVPVVPGTAINGSDPDAAARDVGFPLVIKAEAGGGGIGMRLVKEPGALRSSIAAARSTAERSFGDSSVYVERYFENARHIEVQVFGFGDGTAIHLFERDCSLQRRFQKIIEEAPAPLLSETLQGRLAAAAVSLCAGTAYRGAGTVEFIVDRDADEFFFLEMNTRIQVEHPVTEMITGCDLVAMQIQLAFNEVSRPVQHQIRISGAAIECRLYAEDPARNFMPSPGIIRRFSTPEFPFARIERAYDEGDEISPYYDPLIAKVIAHGESRSQALRRMDQVLDAIELEGLASNLRFLRELLSTHEFSGALHNTRFVEKYVATAAAANSQRRSKTA